MRGQVKKGGDLMVRSSRYQSEYRVVLSTNVQLCPEEQTEVIKREKEILRT